MRWPLRYQILVPFAGVMLAVVLGVSLLNAVLAARRTQRQIEQQLGGVARTLAEAHFPLTDAVLKQTSGLSGAEFVLVDRAGGLRASSFEEIDLRALPAAEATGGVPQRRLRLAEAVDVGGRRYLHAAIDMAPRGTSDETVRLHILYPEAHLRQARFEAAYPPLVVGGVLLVVVVALAMTIAGRLARPILELRRELGRLVQGEFQPLAVPKRNDELADLVRSVNSLGSQLDELQRVIKRSERLALLGQLSGGLAHQLRNSVTGARIATQLHARHCPQPDADSLAVALRQLTITEAHLQRFLSAGQPATPHLGHCDVADVIGDVESLVAAACRHKNVTLSLPARAELAGAGTLWADAAQLRDLLLNLTLNAIEAADTGGWVRIEAQRDREELLLRVVDGGPGPRADLRERMFEPFATSKPEGVGLGLAVARQIALAHGGALRYRAGRPTTFEVALPLWNEAPDATARDCGSAVLSEEAP